MGVDLSPDLGATTWLGIALAGASLALLPTLGYGLGFDHGFFQYIAAAALRGQWPYADALDTSFPGVFLLHMGVLATAGRSVLALRVTDFVIELAAAGLLFTLARRIGGSLVGVYAACAYAVAYAAGTYYHTAQRDGFLVPFLLAMLLGVWQFLDQPSRRAPLVWAAASVGIACLIRPTYALVVAMGVVLLALRPVGVSSAGTGRVRVSSRGVALLDAVAFGGVAAVPILLFLFCYAVTGHLRAITDLLALLSTVYVYIERVRALTVLQGFWSSIPKLIWLGVFLSVASPVWRTRRMELGTAALLFLGCVLVRLWEAKAYRYQYWPSIACLSIPAAIGWVWLATSIVRFVRLTGNRARTAVAAILVVALLAQVARGAGKYYRGLPAAIAANADPNDIEHMIADSPSQAALARFLRTHMAPGDRVQMWGPETIVLFATGHQSATRFIDPGPFLCPKGRAYLLFDQCGPTWNKPIQVQFLHELLGELATNPPRYIAAHDANGSLAIDETYSVASDLPALRELLDQRYTREATFGSWSAFRRIGP
jgi:hypothetical protein